MATACRSTCTSTATTGSLAYWISATQAEAIPLGTSWCSPSARPSTSRSRWVGSPSTASILRTPSWRRPKPQPIWARDGGTGDRPDEGTRTPRPGSPRSDQRLTLRRSLQFDRGPGALERGPGLLGVFLVGLLDHGLGRGLDQILGLLEAEAGEGSHLLDDRDLLAAGRGEDDVELVLLLLGR